MRKGFTLLELIIVVVIIGILASLAIPQYMATVERSRAAEGVVLIGAVRRSNMRYRAEHGTYTTTETRLDYIIETPRFFLMPTAGAGAYLASVRRNSNQSSFSGTYTLRIRGNGDIVCSGGSGSICTRMGY